METLIDNGKLKEIFKQAIFEAMEEIRTFLPMFMRSSSKSRPLKTSIPSKMLRS
jgi:hypothetical protein